MINAQWKSLSISRSRDSNVWWVEYHVLLSKWTIENSLSDRHTPFFHSWAVAVCNEWVLPVRKLLRPASTLLPPSPLYFFVIRHPFVFYFSFYSLTCCSIMKLPSHTIISQYEIILHWTIRSLATLDYFVKSPCSGILLHFSIPISSVEPTNSRMS